MVHLLHAEGSEVGGEGEGKQVCGCGLYVHICHAHQSSGRLMVARLEVLERFLKDWDGW